MAANSSPTIICLMGPTASGKTNLAIELVQRLPCEIISVDSVMIYKGMDIGTAKPDAATLKIAPHRLIDILDPPKSYSAAQFCLDAAREIKAILAQGKTPLLVGGTMMYFNALQNGLSHLPTADEATREKITKQAEQHGWPALHQRLSQIDPQAAARIHQHDAQRLQRALEVYELTGKSLTDLQNADVPKLSNYNIINLAVAPTDRAILHERIAQRFHDMLAAGFIDEVKSLYERGDLSLDTPAMRAVGYRQVWEYLQGQSTYEEMCDKGIAATRQLAKRQLTWLRQWSSLVAWFDSMAPDLFISVLTTLATLEG